MDVVLGVDPGCIHAGFSVVHAVGSRVHLLDYGVLSLNASLPLYRRIGMFHRFFDAKIQEHRVTVIALETPFLGKNVQNFLKLGYLRGVLYLLQDMHNVAIHEFAPAEIKRSITGHGGADKEQVSRLLQRLFPALEAPKKLDITDAIAVSVCGAWQHRALQRMSL
jgi:crossover junction endodeoxyribonuclease RuvC